MNFNRIFKRLSISLMLVSFCANSQDWQSLFNGENLKNWEQIGGNAKYFIEGDAIVGEAVLDSPNSFLTTEKIYGDFIFEVEVYVSTYLNSGIQIRSNSNKDYKNGRFHGYQVEIDPSDRSYSGGIYDEARRGWLYPLGRNEKAKKALKKDSWNVFHIEAIGNEINTWINGVHCARVVDDMTAEGRIGLQVHSAGRNSGLEGAQVKWKNPKILTFSPKEFVWNRDPSVPEISYLKNVLTEWETRNGFRLLWDGKTTKGWRGAKLEDFPEKGWQIKDGVLTVLATDGGESTGPGDIVTTNMYSNFELELEFMITEGANSGIKYYVDPALNKGKGSAIGCEFQILDDKNHPDAKKGVNGNRTVGSLYDLMTAENLSVLGRKKPFKGVGKWNKARIVAKEGKVEHWLNNDKVIEYNRFSQMFRALVAYSKYKNWENFGRWPEGNILLQDHGDEVSFRSIKIRELN